MSGIWYTDDQQKEKIMKSKVELEKKMGKTIVTEIAPLGDFYLAEEYHQKYLDRSLRQNVVVPNGRPSYVVCVDVFNGTPAIYNHEAELVTLVEGPKQLKLYEYPEQFIFVNY